LKRLSLRVTLLMGIPLAVPLAVVLYNRRHPMLWGIPFFYWFQCACAVVAMVCLAAVLAVGRKSR
jgi:uncharacterized membrane protein